MEGNITFCVFADLHYKYGMYISSVSDLRSIIERAHKSKADFIIHCGDFCNDYYGSPELWKEYLNNEYGLKVYGVYGNHELESRNNSMEYVTPKLTNDPAVVWGTENGDISDGNIGYYYFDKNGFRIICTDTEYSYNEEKAVWEHNRTQSYGPPAGNVMQNSLGKEQMLWLKKVLFDAAQKGLRCVVFSHDGLADKWPSSPDAEKVRALFDAANGKRSGTVLMAVNGHQHKNSITRLNSVIYLNVNSTKNGTWIENGFKHYIDEHTYLRAEYDDEGRLIEEKRVPVNTASMAKNTWFFEKPLSAIITVYSNGKIVIDGMKTGWIYGVIPDDKTLTPEIVSGTFWAK